MASVSAQAATGAADTSLPPMGEVKCPHVNPGEILPLKCPSGCGHFIHTHREARVSARNGRRFVFKRWWGGGGRKNAIGKNRGAAAIARRVSLCIISMG